MTDIIKATIVTADVPNANGRTYARATLEKAVEAQKHTRTWVTLGMPNGSQVDLSEIAGQAGNWAWHGDDLVAEIAIMDTPRGRMVKEILEAKDDFDYRPAGYGKVDEAGNVTDFRFVSIGVLAKGTGA